MDKYRVILRQLEELPMFDEADIISRYSRADALRDGTLIDATAIAREAGIRYPTALTRAAWERCVTVPAGIEAQDEAGRLWDFVGMLRLALSKAAGDTVRYRLHVHNDNRRPKPVTLKAVYGPGDDAELVITVMLPDED
jgi:hypothetical protein